MMKMIGNGADNRRRGNSSRVVVELAPRCHALLQVREGLSAGSAGWKNGLSETDEVKRFDKTCHVCAAPRRCGSFRGGDESKSRT